MPPPADFTSIDEATASYPILDELRALLGTKVVLIPIPSGQKRPVVKGWQAISVDEMQKPGYLGRLNRGNIGVLLGVPSNGLCAIDIDSDSELESFMAVNPDLRDTLITRGARGAQVWCKIEGEYPPLTKLKTKAGKDFGEWRASGGQSVIYGTHPSGVRYQRITDLPPVTIRFE